MCRGCVSLFSAIAAVAGTFVSRSCKAGTDPCEYEYDGVEKLLPRMMDSVTVSPDGCRAAFSHQGPTGSRLRDSRLKMMSLCEGSGEL